MPTPLTPEIQALLRSDTPGWNGQNGLPQVVTYSFAQDGLGRDAEGGTAGLAPGAWAPFDPAWQQLTRQALAAWSEVSGLFFVEVPDQPAGAGDDIRLRMETALPPSATGSAAAGAGGYPRDGDIAISPTQSAASPYSLHLLLHEVGHALGLKHSFQGAVTLPAGTDSFAGTVMSYTPGGSDGDGLGTYDVPAIQYVYGTAADEAAMGLGAAYDAEHDRVVLWAGDGPQAIHGVDYREVIHAGAGARTIVGGSGDTTIHGGAGGQTIRGGALSVMPGGHAGETVVHGGAGDDSIAGGIGDDWLAGGQGSDTIDGGGGSNTLGLDVGLRAASIAKSLMSDHAQAADGHSIPVYQGTATAPGETDQFRNITSFAFLDGRLTYDPDDAAAQVTRLYQAALGRAPDPGGLSGWTYALDHGAPLKAAAAGLVGSAEFAARFSVVDDGAFVEQMYRTVLHRGSDPAGKESWTGPLASHAIDRADVLVGFSESAENMANAAAASTAGVWVVDALAAQLARLYDTVLGRLPDAAGLAGWKAAVEDGGQGMLQVAGGFIGSAEFGATYGTPGDDDFVAALYDHALHRQPDAAGLAYWTGALARGASRAEVVLGLSDSPEHTADTAAHIWNDDPPQYGIAFL